MGAGIMDESPVPDKLHALAQSGKTVSVVLPAYNEAQRLPATLRAVHRFLEEHLGAADVIVVDDGSTDGTADVAEALARELPGVRVLRNSSNRGKGAVVRQGLAAAHGDYLLFMDADHSTDIAELSALPDLLERKPQADIFVSSRYLPESRVEVRQPPLRVLVSRISNLVIRTLAVPGIRDTQNGFKIFSRQAFTAVAPHLTIDRWGFDVEMLLVARRLGFRIVEFPITWRNSSDSRLQLGRDLRRTSADFLRILSNRARGRYPRAAIRPSARTTS